MEKYLRREVYDKLLAWKSQPNRSTLEISGVRQAGKTYIVNKFADEQYVHKIYVNLFDFSGDLFLEYYEKMQEDIYNGSFYDNPIYELIKRYQEDFVDSEDTIIIIDEIQESAALYNRIREFSRMLKCDFVVVGSYPRRILNTEFMYSAGDLDSIEIQTLNFEEFLYAMSKHDLFDIVDLYGKSDKSVYQELESLYQIYTSIGGYPAVVLQYLENASIEDCHLMLLKIIELYVNESKRYFDDTLDEIVDDNIFHRIARILIKEKKGFYQNSFNEELQCFITRGFSQSITKSAANRVVNWLYNSGIIGFAGKLPDFCIFDLTVRARCYFMDVGITNYLLTHIGCNKKDIDDIVNENFVFLDLKRRISHPSEIALETPAIVSTGNGEMNFYVKTLNLEKTYAIEVNAGNKNSETVQMILDEKITDYILFTKRNTQGGINDNIYMIPIYGISKFSFS